MPADPHDPEATAQTIAQLRSLLADHAAGKVESQLWEPPAGAAEAPQAPESSPPAVPAGSTPAASVEQDQPKQAPAGGHPSGFDTQIMEQARQIALRQLSFSARSRHQLAVAMAERDIPDDVCAELLDRFERVGLVDDAEYAAVLVRTRYRERGLARRALSEELSRKGIDPSTAAEALEQIDGDDEARSARQLVLRRLPSMDDVPAQKRRQRLYAMLGRRGYPSGVALPVIDEALAEYGLPRQ